MRNQDGLLFSDSNIMSSAALASAKAKRSGGISTPNLPSSRRPRSPPNSSKLPRPWAVLTDHDIRLGEQSKVSESLSSQVGDIAKIMTAHQAEIDALKSSGANDEQKELATKVAEFEGKIDSIVSRLEKIEVLSKTKSGRSK